MNKLIIDKENVIDITDNIVELEIKVNKIEINVKGRVLINEITKKDNEDLDLTINVLPNSSLLYNRFIVENKMNNNITINQLENSTMIFNYSLIANDTCKININSILKGDNNNTEINIKGVTENKGSIYVNGTADVLEKIKNNNLLESIKILMLNNEQSTIIPNLLVASNEVEVNHAATISSIDKDELFYLNSKGISNNKAIKILKEGYLLSNLDLNDTLKERVKEILGGE